MKYSLRSLMIVVTLVCVVIGGRIEYLRRWAVFHEEEAMKFTIRDLLLVTVIVALVVGWWVHQRRLKSEFAKERWFRFGLVEMAPRPTQTGYRMWRETLPLPNPSAPAPNPPKP
jgi:hypothetical protein